jgi:SAM-dependent methyltransferase
MAADQPPGFVPRGRLRALVYGALLASAHALHKMGNGFLFTAAGVLRRDELQAASIDQYRFFNISTADVDSGLTPGEREFYPRYLRPGDRVLLVGCGTGRDLIALRELGYDVTGLEPIQELVDIARMHLARRGMSAPLLTGPIQTADLNGTYHGVIFSGCCYAMMQGEALRVATLKRLLNHLDPNGRVIISYQGGGQSGLGHWVTRVSARLTRADWSPEPGDTFTRDFAVAGLIRYQHAFAPSEFARECEAAGLNLFADEWFDDGCRYAAAERRR